MEERERAMICRNPCDIFPTNYITQSLPKTNIYSRWKSALSTLGLAKRPPHRDLGIWALNRRDSHAKWIVTERKACFAKDVNVFTATVCVLREHIEVFSMVRCIKSPHTPQPDRWMLVYGLRSFLLLFNPYHQGPKIRTFEAQESDTNTHDKMGEDAKQGNPQTSPPKNPRITSV